MQHSTQQEVNAAACKLLRAAPGVQHATQRVPGASMLQKQLQQQQQQQQCGLV
jgi:hypothetical protein